MTEPIMQRGASVGHRGLLVLWRYLPLPLRRIAIRLLFPSLPVGAIAIIRDDVGRVLLVRQTYHREGVSWGVPGGWATFGETPVQAAVRETFEETGLRVSARRVLSVGGGPYGEISIAYECQVVGDTGFHASEETDQIGYFPTAALPPMTPATRRMLNRALVAQARWIERADAADHCD